MKKWLNTYFIKQHKDHWNELPRWLRTGWKVAITISIGVQVSPLVYHWTH